VTCDTSFKHLVVFEGHLKLPQEVGGVPSVSNDWVVVPLPTCLDCGPFLMACPAAIHTLQRCGEEVVSDSILRYPSRPQCQAAHNSHGPWEPQLWWVEILGVLQKTCSLRVLSRLIPRFDARHRRTADAHHRGRVELLPVFLVVSGVGKSLGSIIKTCLATPSF